METADAAVVRVREVSGRLLGSGFLVAPGFVLTCAHVVAGRAVRLEFPLLERPDGDPVPVVDAEVLALGPQRPDRSGDTALVAVRSPLPPGARPVPLVTGAGWDDGVRACGFTEHRADGVWVAARLRGRQGTGWLQMVTEPGHPAVERGFSGSPAWVDRLGGVAGMIVATARGEGTDAYLVPTETLLDVHPELRPTRRPCPYRGLEPFREEDAGLFHGRADAVRRLTSAVAKQPLVVVAGPSGSGKSSLVLAGLLPRTRARVVRFRPDPDLPPALLLATVLVPVLEPDLGEVDRLVAAGKLAELLADPAGRAPALLADRLASRCGEAGLLVFADQFEELAAGDPERARTLLGLIVALVTAGPGGLRAVLTLRSASLDELLTGGTAEALDHGIMLLGPMSRGELREAITGPVPEGVFEAGLVERVLDDAGAAPGRLPLVEFTLTRLWEGAGGGQLTHAEYERLGGVSGALAGYADAVYREEFDAGTRAAVRKLLTRLARPEEDGGFSRRPVRVAELPSPLHPVLAELAARRLVVLGQAVDGGEIADLAHQALIDQWARLRGWLAEDREFQAWLEDLRPAVTRWEAGRDPGTLLRGGALATAQDWVAGRGDDVPAAQRRFVQAGVARRRREVRTWQLITALIAVLALVVGGLGVRAWSDNRDKQRQLRSQAAQLIGREAQRQAGADPVTALQLALGAWHNDSGTAEAYGALLQQRLSMGSVTAVHAGLWSGTLTGWASTSDGSVLGALVRKPDGSSEVTVWTGFPAGRPQAWHAPATAEASAVALSEDGAELAVAGRDGVIRVWDLTTKAEPTVLRPAGTPVPEGADRLVFSLDGAKLLLDHQGRAADGRYQPSAVLWDLAGRSSRSLPPPRTESGGVAAYSLGPDSGTFVVPGTGALTDALTGRKLRDLPVGGLVIGHGAAVAACTDDGRRVRIVDTATGTDRLSGPLTFCEPGGPASFGVDTTGRYVVEETSELPSDGDYGIVLLVDSVTGKRYQFRSPRLALAGTSERLMAVPRPDGTVTVFAATGTSVLAMRATETPAGYRSARGVVSPDGRYDAFVVGTSLVLTDTAAHAVLAEQPVPDPATPRTGGAVAFTADSRHLAVADPGAVTVHAVPGLAVERSFRLDPRCDPRAGTLGVTPGPGTELVVQCGEVLSRWDAATGARLGASVTVGDDFANVQPRPGHPGEVFVSTADRGAVELWDVRGRERLASLETGLLDSSRASSVQADESGARLAVHTADGAITVWDVDARRRIHGPIAASPDTGDLVGFGPDETLLVDQDRSSTLQIWHLPSRRLLGAAAIPTGTVRVRGDTLTLPTRTADWIFRLDPATWFADLCRAAARDYIEAERALLPAGAATEPPCVS
ncbi:nSTAND1 domain-containing NTPase [Amycolatopsis tolypomycina]|uniref:nSTAND1 domain-containing NTPase n=1 Tax=Amycolatopsis tolypomycina TaxID=208445 RepID=UPI0033AC479C